MAKKNYSVSLNPDMVEELKKIAKNKGTSLSGALNWLGRRYVSSIKKRAEMEAKDGK